MLTTEVKQRINTCRDILVGKLPDPKSQVIQITNALIYKFMDDQDRLAQKLKGKPSFFTGNLKPYAWHKLFDSKLTNQERADLYVEGIEKLSVAKNLPELFQDIFKEAYVPFKAAGTLTLFIEEINKFDYTHSEELGNAYEYLLSIMGSQGDAGQFRTPRHIIEFMVDVIDPQKNETVFDPACGTAGFLISAFKHIAEANSNKLTATDKKKLAENIVGVDISPDMAKMARVNLYLHGFTSPEIKEGDTLTDEPLWGTKYDVILANPPFMSPKGGIIPHDKFAIKAKRAEVLFTDFIAEHLKLKGRAAIIVPEGVIFQSGTTYKALRKILVDDGYLHSVISLPAGVFQPYSGVKTSILVLDRERAKESSEVLFMKIENDGYSLGSQRTEKAGDQLPEALSVAKAWQKGDKQETSFASWVTKEEIAESGEYNLTGEKYSIFTTKTSSWPLVKLEEVCTFEYGKSLPKRDRVEGPYPVMGSNGRSGFNDKYLTKGPSIIVGRKGSAGEIVWEELDSFPIDTTYYVQIKKDAIDLRYLYYLLKSLELQKLKGGAGIPGLNRNDAYEKEIPLPSLGVQKETVAELDRYQKIIDGARQVVENYKPSFKIDPKWDLVAVEEVCKVIGGGTPSRSKKEYWGGDIPWLSARYLSDDNKVTGAEMITKKGLEESSSKIAPKGSTILITRVSVGKFAIADKDYALNQDLTALISKDERLKNEYLYLITSILAERVKLNAQGVGVVGVTRGFVNEQKIPLPPLDEQERLVKNIQEERAIVMQSKRLVDIFEQKIQDKISEVWGE